MNDDEIDVALASSGVPTGPEVVVGRRPRGLSGIDVLVNEDGAEVLDLSQTGLPLRMVIENPSASRLVLTCPEWIPGSR